MAKFLSGHLETRKKKPRVHHQTPLAPIWNRRTNTYDHRGSVSGEDDHQRQYLINHRLHRRPLHLLLHKFTQRSHPPPPFFNLWEHAATSPLTKTQRPLFEGHPSLTQSSSQLPLIPMTTSTITDQARLDGEPSPLEYSNIKLRPGGPLPPPEPIVV